MGQCNLLTDIPYSCPPSLPLTIYPQEKWSCILVHTERVVMDNWWTTSPRNTAQEPKKKKKKNPLVELKALLMDWFKDPFCLPSHCTKVSFLQILSGMPLEAWRNGFVEGHPQIWILDMLARVYYITVFFPHLSFSTCTMERIVVWLTLPGHRMNAVTDRKVFQMENAIK